MAITMASTWLASNKKVKSVLAGLFPTIKQSMLVPLQSICTMVPGSSNWSNGLLEPAAGPLASSKSASWPSSWGTLPWYWSFLAWINPFSVVEEDKLAFLATLPPWMNWTMGKLVGLSLRYWWPSNWMIRSLGKQVGFSSWNLSSTLLLISTMAQVWNKYSGAAGCWHFGLVLKH